MNLFTLALIGVGLSIDSFAASITTGACSYRVKVGHVLKIAAVMAFFQGFMPLIGWGIGQRFKSIIAGFDHWVAFVLLLIIGIKFIYEGIRSMGDACQSGFMFKNNLVLMGMALATSIDALIIGVSFGLMEINIWFAMLIIAISTFVFSSLGVVVGQKIGEKINKGIEIFGGAFLILLGVKILGEHLFF